MKHSYFKIPGWFNYSETYDMIVDQIPEDGKIVEIGSFLGRSTHYLATSLVNANKEDVKIYCVDTFAGSSEHANLKLPQDFSDICHCDLKTPCMCDCVRCEHEEIEETNDNDPS